jgi:hypothetical protein
MLIHTCQRSIIVILADAPEVWMYPGSVPHPGVTRPSFKSGRSPFVLVRRSTGSPTWDLHDANLCVKNAATRSHDPNTHFHPGNDGEQRTFPGVFSIKVHTAGCRTVWVGGYETTVPARPHTMWDPDVIKLCPGENNVALQGLQLPDSSPAYRRSSGVFY